MFSLPVTFSNVTLFTARLVRLTRLDGTILRVAEADESITVGAETFTPLPGCEISAVKHILGGEPGSMQINFAHSDGGTIDTGEVASGFWDGTKVELYIVDRNSLSSLGDSLFTGTVQPAICDPIGGSGSFDIRGIAANAEAFIQTFQPMCRTDWASALCQVDPDAYEHTGTIGAIINRFEFTVAGLGAPPADNWFNGGVAELESGFKFEISGWTQSTLRVKTFLPVCVPRRLIVGEDITLWPGCDKTTGPNGCPKFSNIINFQGEPHFLGINSIVGV